MIRQNQKFQITASTIIEATDDVNALTQGIRVFKNLDVKLICDMSKIRLDVKPIENIEKDIK